MKTQKYLLNTANIFTWLIQFVTVIAMIQEIYWAVKMFLVNDISMYSKFFVLSYTVSPNMTGQRVLSFIVIIFRLLLLSAIFMIMLNLRKMIKNIKARQYFVIANLKVLKSMLIAGSVAVLTQIVQIAALYPWVAAINAYSSATTRNHEFVTWMFEVVFLVVLFIVYSVFASGLKIQKENNEII
ncbi:hypothetical protein GNF18_04215 [Ligilactobacillus pobuzihii]|uniref:DUF2975 domain-containing protein n=1 Tax=Ligilactobacillus pobuzihii TaxID=449659 RepID=UPI0019D28FFD|nr:DUF2975 domain-containing protein [Ligilactobacillus pobuzihii]MBN7274358.1 hypothetical protein [Ligilactobacillus pobuzihii]